MNNIQDILNKLSYAKEVFEKWDLDTYILAVSSLETFIRVLNKYDDLDKVPSKVEKSLLQMLKISSIIDGELTEDIIKGKTFISRPKAVGVKKESEIIYKYISDTTKEWVKFCLVQLDFSIKCHSSMEFCYVLKDKIKIKKKVFRCLEIAEENDTDVICFPELSFAKEWVEEIKNKFKDMIIIGGSYYEGGYNICPIIIYGVYIEPPYKKHKPSTFENPETTGRGMKSGKSIYIFQTKCGMFAVLSCIDYADQSYRVCRYCDVGVDFIINPCYDNNISRFQPRCNSDCEDYGVNIIQVNKSEEESEYGKSCIIGKEHKSILKRLIDDKFKPVDDIKYKLFQLNGEMMMIADLNISIKAPPVSVDINYTGRIKVRKERCYIYKKEDWLSISN